MTKATERALNCVHVFTFWFLLNLTIILYKSHHNDPVLLLSITTIVRILQCFVKQSLNTTFLIYALSLPCGDTIDMWRWQFPKSTTFCFVGDLLLWHLANVVCCSELIILMRSNQTSHDCLSEIKHWANAYTRYSSNTHCACSWIVELNLPI